MSMKRRRALVWIAGVALLGGAAILLDGASRAQNAGDAHHRNDERVRAARDQAWQIVAELAGSSADGVPQFASWSRAEEIFGSEIVAHSTSKAQPAEPEIIIFTFYNPPTERHIRDHRLHAREQLDWLRANGPIDLHTSDNRTVPPLPDGSVVVLTAWWPVAQEGSTAVPVWDPELNPPLRYGNSYATWARVVGVSRTMPDSKSLAPLSFLGRTFPNSKRVALDRFHHFRVDAALAQKLMEDERTRKAAIIALGRGIEPGDSLALVALHVAAKRANTWHWATLWWHDEPNAGEFAAGRPRLTAPWDNYLMDVAGAESESGETDICFNPWLEARFADGGSGGGTQSNCIACHQRASYPPVSFLPVTRGAPDFENDPAYASDRLRTDFMWSIARRAR